MRATRGRVVLGDERVIGVREVPHTERRNDEGGLTGGAGVVQRGPRAAAGGDGHFRSSLS